MPIDLVIISGFLGVGKTTLIRKLIKNEFKDLNIAVVENEFGEIGIDKDLLKGLITKIIEIRSGCICCSMIGEFKSTIVEIIKVYSPELILIEPSGIVKTSELINYCLDLEGLVRIKHIINVVDCNNHHLYLRNFEGFYKNQIISSNIVVLNKIIDIKEENLESLESKIKLLNPNAIVIREGTKVPEIEDFSYVQKVYDHNINEKESIHKSFEQLCFITDDDFDRERIQSKLEKLDSNSEYGEILRVKGILNSTENYNLRIDYVPFEINIEGIPYDGIGRICIIGLKLKREKIKDLFKAGLL